MGAGEGGWVRTEELTVSAGHLLRPDPAVDTTESTPPRGGASGISAPMLLCRLSPKAAVGVAALGPHHLHWKI